MAGASGGAPGHRAPRQPCRGEGWLPLIERLLAGEALELDEVPNDVERGSTLLLVDHPTGRAVVPVWVQAKVTLMLDDVEGRLLALRPLIDL